MSTARMIAIDCPKCGHTLDACTGIGHENSPSPGDLTLCIKCAAYLQFDDDLKLVTFPEEQLLDLDDETRITLTRGRRLITQREK